MEELERTPEIKFILALNEMVCVGGGGRIWQGKGKASGAESAYRTWDGRSDAPSCSMRNTEKCPWSSWSDRMTPASS